MGKVLSVFVCLLMGGALCVSTGAAKEYKGEIEAQYLPYIQIGDDEVAVQVDVDVFFQWKAWSLLSEPVEMSRIAFIVSKMGLLEDKQTGKKYSLLELPEDLLETMRFYSVEVLAGPAPHRKMDSYAIGFDPGASARTYFGTLDAFKRLDKEQKKPYLSYNVPGSPSWDRFISRVRPDSGLDYEDYYHTAVDAKARFNGGIVLDTLEIVDYSVDFTGLKLWVLEQRKPTPAQYARLEAEKQRQLSRLKTDKEKKLREKKEQPAEVAIDDFFDTLENELDPVEQIEADYEKARRAILAEYEAKEDRMAGRAALERLEKERQRIRAEMESDARNVDSRRLPTEADRFEVFREGYGKYGYKHGDRIVIPARFESAGAFSEGLAYVEVAYNKKGFIDTRGNMMIDCKAYREARAFREGMAPVSIGYGKWGFIDRSGKQVVACRYQEVNAFSEGLAAVKKGNKWGFIDSKGALVVPHKYASAYDFAEGFALVSVADENYRQTWGFIDSKGAPLVPCRFEFGRSFKEGFAGVQQNGKWGVIDAKGDLVIAPKYHEISDFSEGLARVAVKRRDYSVQWGVIDSKGKTIADFDYLEVSAFKNGTATVVIEKSWEGSCSDRVQHQTIGTINRRGEMIGPPVEKTFGDPGFCGFHLNTE